MRVFGTITTLGCVSIGLIGSLTGFASPLDSKSKAAGPHVATAPVPAGLHYYTPPRHHLAHSLRTDVCVYGATSAGVIAAVQLRTSGLSVVLIEQSGRLGGMTSGGLSNTDIGNKDAIGGMSREFYRAIGKHYGEAEEWTFEPHVAENVYEEMVKESHIPVYYREFIKSAVKVNGKLISIVTESGMTVEAKEFIDASYEGDLMARARVSYAVGREDNREYSETVNGAQVSVNHQFLRRVDPFEVEGDSSTPALPSVDETPLPPPGTGDKRVQAYNFRLCLTTKPENRIPFSKPKGYDSRQYILLKRLL